MTNYLRDEMLRHELASTLFRLIVTLTASSAAVYALSLGGLIFLCAGTTIVSAMALQDPSGCVQVHQQAFSLLFWYLKNNPQALGIPTGLVINIIFFRFQKLGAKNRTAQVTITQQRREE